MICANFLYAACYALFARYPPAVTTATASGSIRSMLLMLPDGDGARFFVLTHDRRNGRSLFLLRQRDASESVDIRADDDAAVPDAAVNVIAHGVPIPRDGSFFGWRRGDAILALIPVYTSPEPFCVVLPRADVPEVRWPPFTEERLPGLWFWKHYGAGRIISVAGLVAAAPATVFWANTKAALGADCCVVARDIEDPDGYTLPRGVYAYYKVLQDGHPVPSLAALLADSSKADLAPNLRRFLDTDGWPQAVDEPVGPRHVRHGHPVHTPTARRTQRRAV
jgi:hypothetical protein